MSAYKTCANYKTVNTASLFWREYPYKIVTVSAEIKTLADELQHMQQQCNFASRWLDSLEKRKTLAKAKRAFSSTMAKPITDKSAIACRDTNVGTNFYFRHAAEAEKFLQTNIDSIKEYHRPYNDACLSLMHSDHRIVMSDRYYWHRYPWKITFKSSLVPHQIATIDEWYDENFSEEKGNNEYLGDTLLSFSERRYVYAVNESDVVMTKVALSEFIDTIHKIVLHKDV